MTAFLPAMQFGIPPWFYDEETNTIAKKFVSIHEDQVYPYIATLPVDGQPIIRPMWWAEPLNGLTYTIADQFLVGDYIIVAPILDSGVKSRSVYLSPGAWIDMENLCMYMGPVSLNYNVTIDSIPYFYGHLMYQKTFKTKNLPNKCQY